MPIVLDAGLRDESQPLPPCMQFSIMGWGLLRIGYGAVGDTDTYTYEDSQVGRRRGSSFTYGIHVLRSTARGQDAAALTLFSIASAPDGQDSCDDAARCPPLAAHTATIVEIVVRRIRGLSPSHYQAWCSFV